MRNWMKTPGVNGLGLLLLLISCKSCLLHRIIYLPLMYIFEFLLYTLCDKLFMHWKCQWTRICLKCFKIFKIVVIITYTICLCNRNTSWHDRPLSLYYILFRTKLHHAHVYSSQQGNCIDYKNVEWGEFTN